MQGMEQKTAPVVYYLCRNGKVESPHMIDVAYRSPGLRLRDVKLRLTALRGIRMPAMYSWSFKRIYKSASIWQDVSDDDFVFPVLSGEYVLKGSEIVDNNNNNAQSQAVLKSQSLKQPSEILQRKFWGAESWLTTTDVVPKPRPEQNRKSWEQAAQIKSTTSSSSTATLKRMVVTDPSSSSDEKELGPSNFEAVRHSTGNILHDGIQQGVKLYTVKPPALMSDVGCDAATQTEELRRRNLNSVSSSATKVVEESKPFNNNTEGTGGNLKKQNRLRKVFAHEKDGAELQKAKNHGSSSWVFLHVLSYCGGLDTKARGGSTPLVTKEVVTSDCSQDEHSGESRMTTTTTDGENLSFSDASRETLQSRTSTTTGDSFNSSDASDEGRAHNFVDVKELLVSARSSATATGGGKSFSLLGRHYGRLSKSGTYWPRNVKYDMSRRHLDNGFEINCYNAE